MAEVDEQGAPGESDALPGSGVPEHRSTSAPAPGALDALEELTTSWIRKLAARRPRVLLADGDDLRSIEAAAWLVRHTTVRPVLVTTSGALRSRLREGGVELPSGVEVLDSSSQAVASRHGDVLADAFDRRGLRPDEGRSKTTDPVWLAAAALALGDADACVGGASRPTAEVIRAALRVIGLHPSATSVTSSFLMLLADGGVLAYGDCGVIPDPSAEQLAEIATATGATYRALTGREPVIALLSFSSKGSARHSSVEKVQRATELARRLAPELEIDGELQFDAAYLRAVGEHKAPGSPVPGRANVFIFPNLDAGNIAYKITERVAGAVALGPILQGLGGVVNDLSRGCSARDVAQVALVSAVQSMPQDAGE